MCTIEMPMYDIIIALLIKYADRVATPVFNHDPAAHAPAPPYPNSWIVIMVSSELTLNEVKLFEMCGQQLVAFRGPTGAVHVLSAYCPHLGANLGVGGHVVTESGDDCIQCPFHGWRFKGRDGQCKRIPNLTDSELKPLKAGVKRWPTFEANDLIYVWHHSDGVNPDCDPEDFVKQTGLSLKQHSWMSIPVACNYTVINMKTSDKIYSTQRIPAFDSWISSVTGILIHECCFNERPVHVTKSSESQSGFTPSEWCQTYIKSFASNYECRRDLQNIHQIMTSAEVSFKTMNVFNVKTLTMVGENAFASSVNTTTSLRISSCSLKSSESLFKAISQLVRLTSVDLSDNQEIADNAFGPNQHQLTMVLLDRNQLKTLGKNAFKPLHGLNWLDLSDNLLTKLADNSFTLQSVNGSQYNPIKINFKLNQIAQIGDQAFAGLDRPVTLDLSFNNLTQLTANTFAHMLSYEPSKIIIKGNHVNCVCGLKWVYVNSTIRPKMSGPLRCDDKRYYSSLTDTDFKNFN
ncbi:unnamed protein product [Medioppia subpectinata]|uniref:Rieske domain-containing protein n=1 Tax=Medioppia subpectinata TaxID=1979941 RepID=A0A7R9KEZ9_9ACAR|nr:unnamed protein product [Medioppia subpectinata]CAG2102125.1 unnamed protein product [Medioppia subpectinata]